MRIAYLSVFYPYRGGISQFNACVYRELEKLAEVKAFNFSRQYPDLLFPGKTQYVNEKDNADKIPSERLLDTVNPLSYLKTSKVIIEYKPDLFLLQYWMPYFAPSMGTIAKKVRKTGIPTISIMANIKPHESRIGDDALNKYFIRNNDAFVVLADAVKDDLLYYNPSAKYFKYPHPNYEHFGKKIDKDTARDKLNIPKDKKAILFFGLIRKYKGLDIMLEAMNGLPEDTILLVAGEVYGSFDEYRAIIDRHGLKDRVILNLEYLNDDDVPLWFSAADLCVLPYRSATQSGIVGISYHFGLPVISTDVGGLREVIEPFQSGIVIDSPDSNLLRDAISKYFKENLSDHFIKNINNFKKEYTWAGLAEGIIELYGSISGKNFQRIK